MVLGASPIAAAQSASDWRVDHRYAPPHWQTAICLPDDWLKTLVSKDGSLLYDYPGKQAGFGTRITIGLEAKAQWVTQELVSPRVPIVRTIERSGDVEMVQEAFAAPPSPGETKTAPSKPPRQDIILLRLHNLGTTQPTVAPTLRIHSDFPIHADTAERGVQIGASTALGCSETVERLEQQRDGAILHFTPTRIPPGGEKVLAFRITHGGTFDPNPVDPAQAAALRRHAQDFWQKLNLPYDRLEVPDLGIQAQLDSAIRNIYQAREIKNGLPAFQVGPTCYRGLWVVDGSFLLEAMTYLGRADETRQGVKYLISFQRPDGGFMLIDGHWKETGIALWAITRHARLTGDKAWLREVWPKVERGFDFIRQMRQMPAADAPNARLIPDGFSDGGLADRVPEYTNIYWTMAGMRAVIEAARWLGQTAQAEDWEKEYDDFLATFRRAAERDLRRDSHGNSYLPIRMRLDEKIPPQKAQWAFLHAVFPGKVFAADDPLVRGNLAMLQAVECQGLVLDTGWLKQGIWNYFASFYAHAWLRQGDGEKTARTLYAFANHASPLLAWREEQMPVGGGEQVVGDMPHNWASAEFIRLVRHSLILERGDELHLFEAVPAAWAKPGARIHARQILTEFGPVSLDLRVNSDASRATLKLTPPRRNPPNRIILHLDHWSGQLGTVELPTARSTTRQFRLATDRS